MSQQFVYFLWDSGSHIKIGISDNPQARVASLQTGSARKLHLLLTIAGTQDDEKQLHHFWRSERAVGEWFNAMGRMQLKQFLIFAIDYADPSGRIGLSTTALLDEWTEHLRLEAMYGAVQYEQHSWADSVQAGTAIGG